MLDWKERYYNIQPYLDVRIQLCLHERLRMMLIVKKE